MGKNHDNPLPGKWMNFFWQPFRVGFGSFITVMEFPFDTLYITRHSWACYIFDAQRSCTATKFLILSVLKYCTKILVPKITEAQDKGANVNTLIPQSVMTDLFPSGDYSQCEGKVYGF